MQHLFLNLFVLSIPFALFAESWGIFSVVGGISATMGLVVHLTGLEESAFRGLPKKLKELHDHMECAARRVRSVVRKKADWREKLMEVLPMLDDRSLRMVVLEVLRAEGYEFVQWATEQIDRDDTVVVRKKLNYSVVRVRSESDREVGPEELLQMTQTLYDVHIDRGMAVALGPVTEEANQVARRNQIKILDRRGLAKAMVSCRAKMGQPVEADHVKYTEREPEFAQN